MKIWQQFEPKKPIDGNWDRLPDTSNMIEWIQGFRYESALGIRVVSSVHVVENADGGGASPHYHVSVSDNGKRCPQWAAELVLKQFGAEDFEEDNHSPRKVIRSFWKPVSGHASECPCKENLKPEIDGDYTWRDGGKEK